MLFDYDYYISKYPDVREHIINTENPVRAAFHHFITIGHKEGKDPSIWFNNEYYLKTYPDVSKAISEGKLSNAFEHFIIRGHKEFRNPCKNFSSCYYIQMYPDVREAIENNQVSPFEHFSCWGFKEGKKSCRNYNYEINDDNDGYYNLRNIIKEAKIIYSQFQQVMPKPTQSTIDHLEVQLSQMEID